MIEQILEKNNATNKVKITIKMLISALVVVAAVVLPQLVHLALGQAGGVQWLPMYLPVIIGACLLGRIWGVSVAVLSPLVSFLITLAFGDPMPAAIRLPYMMAELAVMALIAGTFSKKFMNNPIASFAAVFLAFVGGRVVFLAIAAIFQSVSPLSAAVVWSQIRSGLLGMILQILIAPAVIIALKAVLNRKQ